MMFRCSTAAPIFALVCATAAFAGNANAGNANDAKPTAGETPSAVSNASAGSPANRSLYRLGPGDEISVQQPNAEELDGKTARIDDQGAVNLPLAGRLNFGGLTVPQAESMLASSLKRLLVSPEPVIAITEYRSQPVSVLGAVNTPGVIQLQGRKTLVEMLSLAGGLRPDAGTEVQVTRRLEYGRLPLAKETSDPTSEFSIARVNVVGLLKGTHPAENIVIFPQDVISVPRAEQVYVTGDVKKPGGFPVTGDGGISVLQAVSLAEGLGPQASPKNAKIFRPREDGAPISDKTELAVNVADILAGKSEDFTLKPRDILFIPDSKSKKAGVRAAEAALQAATGIAIWGRF